MVGKLAQIAREERVGVNEAKVPIFAQTIRRLLNVDTNDSGAAEDEVVLKFET